MKKFSTLSIQFTTAQKRFLIFIGLIALIFAILLGVGSWRAMQIRQAEAQEGDETTQPANQGQTFQTTGSIIQPIDIQGHDIAARHFSRLDQPVRALPHLRRLVNLAPDNRQAAITLATTLLQCGHAAEAVARFSQIIPQLKDSDSLNRSHILAYYGLALFNNRQIEAAIQVLDSCLAAPQGNALASCFRGQIEAAQDPSSQRAQAWLQQSIDTDPLYTEGRYQLARFLMNKPAASKTEYIAAREQLLSILENRPLDPKTHARLGMTYYYLHQPRLARKSYEFALALNPDDYNTHYNLGELYFTELDDDFNALVHYKKAVDLSPEHQMANFRIGIISLKNNDLNQAIRSLQAARTQSPDNIRILMQLAIAYEKKEMSEQARSIYEDILTYDELNAIARQKLSQLR